MILRSHYTTLQYAVFLSRIHALASTKKIRDSDKSGKLENVLHQLGVVIQPGFAPDPEQVSDVEISSGLEP